MEPGKARRVPQEKKGTTMTKKGKITVPCIVTAKPTDEVEKLEVDADNMTEEEKDEAIKKNLIDKDESEKEKKDEKKENH